MARVNTALKWLGRLAGVVALIGFVLTVLIVVGLYALGAGTFDVPVIGTAVIFVPPAVTIAALLAWGVLWLVRRYLVTDDRRARRSTTTHRGSRQSGQTTGTSQNHSTSGVQDDPTTAATAAQHPDRDDHLRTFNKANTYLTVILGFFLVISIVASPLTAAVSGTPLGIIVGFLVFAATMLGGTMTLLVMTAWFGLAWYGIRTYAATEAWIAGVVGWTLLTLSGLSLLATSLGALAIVIGGIQVLRIGVRARDETEIVFVDEFVESIQNDAHTDTTGGDAGELSLGGDAGELSLGGDAEELSLDSAAGPMATSGESRSEVDDGRIPMAVIRTRLTEATIESLDDVRELLDVDPVFVHPREAGHDRLTYLSYLSYALGGLLVLSSLLVGVQLWGFPSLGVWGLLAGVIYLAHGFGLPQRSPVVHAVGAIWYVLGLLVAIVTVSPVAIGATAAGVYLAWTATAGVPQPDAVSAAIQGTSADADRPDAPIAAGLIGGGIVAGVILGFVLGLLGAVVFAWVSVQTQTVYGLLVILPALAAGFGVALGTGDHGGLLSGGVAAVLAIVSIALGFRLLNWWMPPFYELQPSPLLAIVPLVGIYLAYRIGSSSAVDPESDPTARSDRDQSVAGTGGGTNESADGVETADGSPSGSGSSHDRGVRK